MVVYEGAAFEVPAFRAALSFSLIGIGQPTSYGVILFFAVEFAEHVVVVLAS